MNEEEEKAFDEMVEDYIGAFDPYVYKNLDEYRIAAYYTRAFARKIKEEFFK